MPIVDKWGILVGYILLVWIPMMLLLQWSGLQAERAQARMFKTLNAAINQQSALEHVLYTSEVQNIMAWKE